MLRASPSQHPERVRATGGGVKCDSGATDPSGLSAHLYRRLTRYAAFAGLHGLVVVPLWFGVAHDGLGSVVLLVVSLPLMWAWGQFQADVALNPWIDEPSRSRWRIALACLPWSMTVYWACQVRTRRPPA